MSFDFSVVGWRGFDQESDESPHRGRPSAANVEPGDVEAVYVHAYDDETGEEHWFWVRTYYSFGDWQEWLDLIGLTMEMHGMTLA